MFWPLSMDSQGPDVVLVLSLLWPAHGGPYVFEIRLTRQTLKHCLKGPAWSLVWASDHVLLIWRLFLSCFVWCSPGSWSWESVVFSISVTQFLSALNLDPFGFWPDQEACSWFIAHSWVCYLSIFIVRVHSALSLKWPCGPGDSYHLVCDSFHPVFAPTSLRASIIPSFSQQILTIYGQGIVSLEETNTSSYSKVPLPVTPGLVWGYLFFSYLFSSIWQPNPSPKVRDTQVSQDRAS